MARTVGAQKLTTDIYLVYRNAYTHLQGYESAVQQY
jgi:hypothetical protein